MLKFLELFGFSLEFGFALWDIGSAIGIGSSVIGMMGGSDSPTGSGGGNVAGGAYYDPYGPYRGKAATALNDLIYGSSNIGNILSFSDWTARGNGGGPLWPGAVGSGQSSYSPQQRYQQYVDVNKATPSSGGSSPMDQILSMPGYQFGMNQGAETLNRTMAASGQTQSGNQQIALSGFGQQYAGSFYDKMVGQLNAMAGIGQSPMSMTGANQLGMQQQQANQSGFMQGLGGLGSIFGGGNTAGVFGGGGFGNAGGMSLGQSIGDTFGMTGLGGYISGMFF